MRRGRERRDRDGKREGRGKERERIKRRERGDGKSKSENEKREKTERKGRERERKGRNNTERREREGGKELEDSKQATKLAHITIYIPRAVVVHFQNTPAEKKEEQRQLMQEAKKISLTLCYTDVVKLNQSNTVLHRRCQA